MKWIVLKRAKIRVYGKELRTLMKGMTAPEEHTHFLHSLLTNNIKALKNGEFNYNLWLRPNGQPVGDFFVYKTGNSYILDTELDKDFVISEFNKLKLSLQVFFEDLTQNLKHLFIFGEGSLEFIKERFGISLNNGQFTEKEGLIIAKNDIRLKTEGYDILGNIEEVIKELKEEEEISETEFEDIRIENCVPRIKKELREGFSPLEANVLNYAIDMNKGCYVGQEAIARVYFRGRTPRTLVKFEVEGSVKEEEEIKDSSGKKAGLITSVNSKGNIALGYVLRSKLEKEKEFFAEKGKLNVLCEC